MPRPVRLLAVLLTTSALVALPLAAAFADPVVVQPQANHGWCC